MEENQLDLEELQPLEPLDGSLLDVSMTEEVTSSTMFTSIQQNNKLTPSVCLPGAIRFCSVDPHLLARDNGCVIGRAICTGMRALFLYIWCFAFMAIPFVWSLVQPDNVPNKLMECYGLYRRRTSIGYSAGSGISGVCDNMYVWMNSKALNINRGAKPATISYITNLFRYTKREIVRFIGRRKKRQAGQDPNAPTTGSPTDGQGLGGPGPGVFGRPGPGPNKLRIRKEIRMMTKREWHRYMDAVNSAKANTSITPNKYDALAEFHTGITSVSAHGGCNFHGWHRMYLLMFENALREEPGFHDVTVPYWDSRLDSRMPDPLKSVVFTDRFYGSCSGEVTGGIMKNGWDSDTGRIMRTCGMDGPLMTDGMVYNVTRRYHMKDICGEDSQIDDDLEFHHNGVHRYIDGHMAMLQSAVFDPIFWGHHCFIDLIWEIFRKNQEKHGVDPEKDYPANPTTMGAHEMHLPDADLGYADLTVADGLSNMFTTEWYKYAPPPTCTVKKRNCGSKYLKCVVDRPNGKRRRARCVSRTLEEVIEWEKEKTKPPVPPECKNNTIPDPWDPNKGPVIAKPTPIEIIKPIQNSFCINGKSDTRQWVYIPVKLIVSRPPELKNYGSYPVERGKVVKRQGDIYSPKAYDNVYRHLRHVDVPAKYEGCIEPDEPTNTIFVRSVGLNYEGVYKEYAIIDRRLAMNVATAYLAIRKPMSPTDVSLAMLHAQDRCGRVCRPICLVPETQIYRPCSGAIKLTGTRPLQYGNSFGDAVLDVWDFNKDKDCPQLTTNNMIVSFYCDYKTDWVWPSVEPPKHIPTPPPMVEKTTITAGCDLGYGCVIGQGCVALQGCTNRHKMQCMDSCHLFARCFNGQYYIHRCRRGEKVDLNSRTGCSRGFCDYKRSRQRTNRRVAGKLRGKRRRNNKNMRG